MTHLRTLLCGAFAAAFSLTSSGCNDEAKAGRCVDSLAEFDADGDGYIAADADLPKSCDGGLEEALASAGLSSGDCDDTSADTWPGAGELCDDGVDQDCDGSDPTVSTWYTDADGDTYGDGLTGQEVCQPPEGSVENGDDCDDTDAAVYPGAVETICGDPKVVPDLNCDNFTDCAIAGNLEEEELVALGVSITLEESAGRSMEAEDAVGGRVLVGGANGAHWVSYSDGALVSDPLTLEDSVSAGIDVAILADKDGDGINEPVVADKAYDGAVGRVSLLYTGGDTGALVGSSASQYVGSSVASAGGLVAAARYLDGDWRVYVLHPDDLPVDGDSLDLSTSVIPGSTYVTSLTDATPSTPPSVAAAAVSSSWLVAVGQPEESTLGNRVIAYAVTEDTMLGICIINDSSDTLGASVLLSDIDGDDMPDLLVGDPGAQSVYVFSDVLNCGGAFLSTRDADYSVFGSVARLGSSMARVPDLNGDGLDDVLIGGANGAVLVLGFDGSTSSSSSIAAYATLSGSGGFGESVASLDINSDGYADLIIGAPNVGQVIALWGGL